MESKKILIFMALIAVLLPSALARGSVVDFETDSAISNEFSEAENENPLLDIILEGPCPATFRRIGRRCSNPRCICVLYTACVITLLSRVMNKTSRHIIYA